jgi:nuclear receptor subfamily 0 group A
MSKSGSRYGRRSNWFKIHCLLQEQQQQQAAMSSHQKQPALSPNSLNLMRHPSYATSIFSRPPPCTKEEMMMLRLDEYAKQHPVAASSPSISSPDSHNSDSSIEIGDKRASLLHNGSTKQQQQQQQQSNKLVPNMQTQLHQPSPLALNKDLFLPLPFASFPLMPPPGFLPPPTHFLFSSYHNALYEQNHHLLQQQVQQGLLKTTELPTAATIKSPLHHNKIERDIDEEEMESERVERKSTKRHFSETLMEVAAAAAVAQRKHHHPLSFSAASLLSSSTKIPKRSHSPSAGEEEEVEEEDIDMNNDESDEVLTPPRSPKSPNNPIDLSMKSGSSTKSDDINHNYYKAKTNNKSDNFAVNGTDNSSDSNSSSSGGNNNNNNNNKGSRKTIHCHDLKDGKQRRLNGCAESEEDDNYRLHHRTFVDDKSDEYEVELKRRKLHLAAPLDLTTKV